MTKNLKRNIGIHKLLVICLMVLLTAGLVSGTVLAAEPGSNVTSAVTVSGTESWSSSHTFSGNGSVTINSGTLTVSGNISFSSPSASQVFTVKNGATLRLTGSTWNLNNIGVGKAAIKVESGGTLTIDNNSTIRSANGEISTAYIFVDGGTLNITGGAAITNNTNNSTWGNIVRVLSGTLNIDNATISNNTNKASNGDYPGTIATQNTAVTINNARFTGNSGMAAASIFALTPTSFNVTGSTFSNNYQGDSAWSSHGGGGIHVRQGNVVIGDGNTFSNNEAIHGGAILVRQGTLTISANNTFSGNKSRYSGGAVMTMSTDVTVEAATFTGNTSIWYGGAMDCKGHSLTLNGTIFRGNKAVADDDDARYGQAGALSVDGHPENLEIPEDRTFNLIINDATFEGNQAQVGPGALTIGYTVDTYGDRDTIKAVIHKAVFRNNLVTDAFVEVGGGALQIQPNATLTMKNVAVVNNKCETGGGGIGACPEGYTYLKIRNGAVIYGNKAGRGAEDYQDIYLMNNESAHEVNEQMFNGGVHNWKIDPNVKAIMVKTTASGRTVETEYTGTMWGSTPSNQDYSNADVIFEGNEVRVTKKLGPEYAHWQNYLQYTSNGGAIANNGNLIIGEDSTDIEITKRWHRSTEGTEARPEHLKLVEALKLTADGNAYDLGTITQESQDLDTSTFTYSCSGDPFVRIVLKVVDADTYSISIKGLPKEINGREISRWTLSEDLAGYPDPRIDGDWQNGFTIDNTFDGKITPTPVITVTPDQTVTPGPHVTRTPIGPWWEFERELPKTGFSAVKPAALSAMPKDLKYNKTGLTLEIPSLSVSTEIVSVPKLDGKYPVEWLGTNAGLLEGFAEPGEGRAILTGHNHLNTTEAGPFAFAQYLQEGDLIFILNRRSEMVPFVVYASEKIAGNDFAALERIASESENSLTLITCEDESTDGGYINRRVVAARPM